MVERIGILINCLALLVILAGFSLMGLFAYSGEFYGVIVIAILSVLVYSITRFIGWIFCGR